MKRILLFLISFVLVGTMMARELTPEQALTLAMGKLNAAQPESAKARAAGINNANVRLTHTEMTGQRVPLWYAYNIAEGGIIIASADDRVSSLLGYTDSGDFDGAKQNEGFMAWLEDCSKALTYINTMPEQTRGAQSGTRALTNAVRPLLSEIKWKQGAPFNLLTPMREGRPNANAELETVHAPVGCVATAMAQVMMYHQWPVTGTGSHTNKKENTQTVDFSQSTYQWSKMLPVYTGGESEESQMAVAHLLYDAGCALDMDYGYAGSGAYDQDIPNALTTHFGYDKSIRYVQRRVCSSEVWNDLIQTELNEQRPVIMGGEAPGGGHAFVIDGYDLNGLYHVNWGWGGRANGYFDMNLMDPEYVGTGGFAGGYAHNQDIIIGVKPDVTGTSVAKPELMMTRQFMYDRTEQKWSYSVCNNGLGDFTGVIGLALESPTGEVTPLSSHKYDEDPILYRETYTFKFSDPEVTGPGYKLYPYYCDVEGGEMKRTPAIYNGYCTLYSVEKDGVYTWSSDIKDISNVTVKSVEVKHHFVGFDPQFNVIISNPADSYKEYVNEIVVQIYTTVDGEEKLVCEGRSQAFIMPGESKEIAVKCNNVIEEFKGKIDAGEYTYSLFLALGGTYYKMKTSTFEMVVAPPSEITYSDFALNKTEYQPDEVLTASLKVTNTGGYDVRTLVFVIASEAEKKTVDYVELQKYDIEPDSNEIVEFKKVLSYAPGKYFGAIIVNGKQLDTPTISFVIADPSAIDKVEITPANDRQKGIYDLQGRPVKQMRQGGLYISKDKIIVIE